MKSLLKYLENRKEAVKSLLLTPRKKIRESTYHEIRIELKKTDALLDLISFFTKNFNRRKVAKPFKLIFYQAGRVRTLQLEEAMLKKYLNGSSITEYLTNLKELRSHEEDKFFLILNEKFIDSIDKMYKVMRSYLLNVEIGNVNSYIEKRKSKIIELLSRGTLRRNQLHSLRKQLKQLNYIRMNLVFKEINSQALFKSDLTELLGKWHDCRVIVNHLNKVIKNNTITPKEENQLEAIKVKIFKESLILIDKINVAIKNSEFS